MLKKAGPKLLSVLLSIGMVASYHPCYAINKAATTASSKQTSSEPPQKVLIGAGVTVVVGVATILIKNLLQNDGLKKQIEIFVNRAPDVFQVEEELIEQTDPELLELSLRKLNDLFDKHKVFIDVLIKELRNKNKKFTLGLLKENIHSIIIAGANIYEIQLNPSYYSKNGIEDYNEGYHSPADFEQRKVYAITHEFGHVIQKIIVHIISENFIKISKNFIKISNTLQAQYKEIEKKMRAELYKAINNKDNSESAFAEYNRLINESGKITDIISKEAAEVEKREAVFSDLPKYIKDEVIKIAQNKYGYFDTKISDYGETNPDEWFAEVFAHLECSSSPNTLGLAMKDYLAQQAKLISQEK